MRPQCHAGTTVPGGNRTSACPRSAVAIQVPQQRVQQFGGVPLRDPVPGARERYELVRAYDLVGCGLGGLPAEGEVLLAPDVQGRNLDPADGGAGQPPPPGPG